jgi:hypothetical protein
VPQRGLSCPYNCSSALMLVHAHITQSLHSDRVELGRAQTFSLIHFGHSMAQGRTVPTMNGEMSSRSTSISTLWGLTITLQPFLLSASLSIKWKTWEDFTSLVICSCKMSWLPFWVKNSLSESTEIVLL